MGANATTFVPAYVAGEVLTAANLSVTNSGIPVFATTVTRDAAFGGTGEKVLAEGQFAYIEATNTTQYYDGAAWQSVGVSPGLVLIKTQTIGTTVASVTVTDAFSATYDNYLVTISGGVASTTGTIRTTLGAAATAYYSKTLYGSYSDNTVLGFGQSNLTFWSNAGTLTTNLISYNAKFVNPYLAKNSQIFSESAGALTTEAYYSFGGYLADTTSYTAFTLTASTGTMTGGTIRVYGYATS